MTEKGEKLLIFVATFFLIACLTFMGYVMVHYEEGSFVATETKIEEEYFVSVEGTEWDIIIPTPFADVQNRVQIEENLANRTLEITLGGLEEDYYFDSQIRGNEDKISQIRYQQEPEGTHLRFVLKDLYVSQVVMSGSEVRMKLENPMEYDEKTVVADGFQNGGHLAALEEMGVKNLPGGDVSVANRVRSDCYLSLSIEMTEAENEIVIYYNDDFFIPDFDSKAFADLIYEQMKEVYGADTVEVRKSENYGLPEAMMPAVKVVGKVSVSEEADVRQVLNAESDKMEAVLAEVLIGLYQEKEE